MSSTTKDSIIGITQGDSFSCIGSRCEDTCCAGWSIPVDRFTLAKWQGDSFYEGISKSLKIINNDNPQDINAANIETLKNGSCPFLQEDKLCKLQIEKGHDFLSFTCRTFPRSRNIFYGIQEEYLSLACPEAARLILMSKDKLSIDFLKNAKTELPVFQHSINAHMGENLNLAWELRTLIYSILQNEDLELAGKLILVGLISKNIEELSSAENLNINDIYNEVINKYKNLFLSKDYIFTLISSIPKSYDLKIFFLKAISQVISKYSLTNKAYNRYFNLLVETFKLNQPISDNELIENYKNIPLDITKESQQILENYTFHLFFRELFPFSNKNLAEHFSFLTLRIYLITHHLISIRNETLAVQIDLIQKFSKLYENTPLLQEAIKSLTKTANFSSIAHTCILINK